MLRQLVQLIPFRHSVPSLGRGDSRPSLPSAGGIAASIALSTISACPSPPPPSPPHSWPTTCASWTPAPQPGASRPSCERRVPPPAGEGDDVTKPPLPDSALAPVGHQAVSMTWPCSGGTLRAASPPRCHTAPSNPVLRCSGIYPGNCPGNLVCSVLLRSGGAPPPSERELEARVSAVGPQLGAAAAAVRSLREASGYHWVQLGTLFGVKA